jgi:hypothetical protein
MKTDLKTQLSGYGQYHREYQDAIEPEDVLVGFAGISEPGPNYVVRRIVVACAAALVIALFIGIPALLFSTENPEPAETPTATVPLDVPESTSPESTSPAVSVPEVPRYEGYAMVEELDDGSVVGIQQGSIWRSEDSGESWSIWYEQGIGIDVMVKAPDGAIIAVFNSNSTTEALGVGSTVNDTPEIHRFDPESREWSIIELERPPYPGGNSTAQPIDNVETPCARSGLSSWVDGNAAMVGDQIVILGDQRVMGKGICEGDFQSLWTSQDGLNWSLIPELGIDGYITELIWWNDQYVAIGADRPHFIGGGGPLPRIWTSSDLESWTERPFDLSSIPSGGEIHTLPEGVTGWTPVPADQAAYSSVPDVGVGADGISITFNVQHYRPGLDESITSIEGLAQWLADAGQAEQVDPSLGELVSGFGIDFPLDAEEVRELNSFFNLEEPFGTFTVTSTDGIGWNASYKPPGS